MKDSRIIFSFMASGKEEIKAWILSFRPKVKLLAPGKKLAEEIKADLAKTLIRYDKTGHLRIGTCRSSCPRGARTSIGDYITYYNRRGAESGLWNFMQPEVYQVGNKTELWKYMQEMKGKTRLKKNLYWT